MKFPKYLFHGTSTAYLDNILRDGLRPESSYKGYLCYADDIEISRHHAIHMAEWDGEYVGKRCYPVIFRIPFSRFDTSVFCLDENFIELGPSAGRAVKSDLRGRDWAWQELLSVAGAVGCTGTMRVKREDIINEMEMAA